MKQILAVLCILLISVGSAQASQEKQFYERLGAEVSNHERALVEAKLAGACEILQEMNLYQLTYQLKRGSHFVYSYWVYRANKLATDLTTLNTRCTQLRHKHNATMLRLRKLNYDAKY